MSVFTRVLPEWIETKHVILGVHTGVGFGFLGLATALYLNGEPEAAALRAAFGVIAVLAGIYLYR